MADFLVRYKLLIHLNKYVMFFFFLGGGEITKWMDEGSPVDIIYLDFQKAFDNVPHQRLLLKLKARDIGNGIIDRTMDRTMAD